MTTTKHVQIEKKEGGILLLTIDRPPVNALGRALVEDLNTVCGMIEDRQGDEAVRAVVLAAAGKCFCAGADLKERQGMSAEDVARWVPYLSSTFTRIAALQAPVIGVVAGVAAGGGLELALACDLRIAEEQASLGLRETALAIIPGAGGTQRLPRLIGPARAKRWIFTAAMHPARVAHADGVVDEVVATGRGLDTALDLAAQIARNGPVAIRLAKRAVEEGAGLPISEALEIERRCYEGVLGTEDRLEALRAFREKRDPAFRGR